MRNLSKSKILAYRQCPKRLWLEIHKPELRSKSESERVFEIGNQVGDIARKIYDVDGNAELIDIHELGHEQALARSAALLANGQVRVFEAGMAAGGALAYADVMVPERQGESMAWKMIEVKSSTSVKDYHHEDIAVQAYIAASSGISLSCIILATINSSFVYRGEGNYRGLLKENDLTEEALARACEVKDWIKSAHTVANMTEEPDIATGPHCNDPFDCVFCDYCNIGKVWPEYPLSALPRFSNKNRDTLEGQGIEDLRHVPDDYLSEVQARVKKHSISGNVYFDSKGAASDLNSLGLPAYFLDFETASFAVPIWKGTRPFEQIPFQFSLHILEEGGNLTHKGFLDLSGNDPSRECASSLVDLCGYKDPIFVYNAGFEKMVLKNLAARFPKLDTQLKALISRIVDLVPIAKKRYYHPSQLGSWSIKAVLPAAIPELSYNQLEGVQDGNMAVSAFIEAIDPATTAERKAEIERQLFSYCQLDTFAMLRLWQFFRSEGDINRGKPIEIDAEKSDRLLVKCFQVYKRKKCLLTVHQFIARIESRYGCDSTAMLVFWEYSLIPELRKQYFADVTIESLLESSITLYRRCSHRVSALINVWDAIEANYPFDLETYIDFVERLEELLEKESNPPTQDDWDKLNESLSK